MNDRIQIVALAASVALLLAVFELVRRRRLSDEHSLLWIVAALALIALSIRTDVLDGAARWLGVSSRSAVLVLLLTLIFLAASLGFSVILSRQHRELERLTEEAAILSAELRELRAISEEPGLPLSGRRREESGVHRHQTRRPGDERSDGATACASGPNLPVT
jgi:hypothetical protein